MKISANSCDEQKLTIPENEKLSFVKHSFTTELSRPDTTFSTKIVTAPDLWALTFHFFEILIFKTFSSNLRLQEILRKRSFWLHLPSFWLDLVTEIHWYLARSEKCFLKIMFSRLECNTASLTKIATFVDVWALTFQCLWTFLCFSFWGASVSCTRKSISRCS